MWLMTNTGFLSIVQKPGDTDTLTVRARAKGHIEAAFPKAKVEANKGTDYLYRARVPRAEVAQVMHDQIMGIDYGNFKSAVKDNALHDAYMSCWHAMYRYQTSQESP